MEFVQHNIGLTPFQRRRFRTGMRLKKPLNLRVRADSMKGDFPVLLTHDQLAEVNERMQSGKGMTFRFNKPQLRAINKLPSSTSVPKSVPDTDQLTKVLESIQKGGGLAMSNEDMQNIIKQSGFQSVPAAQIINAVRANGGALMPAGRGALIPAGQMLGNGALPAGQFGGTVPIPLSAEEDVPIQGDTTVLTDLATKRAITAFKPDPRNLMFTNEYAKQGGFITGLIALASALIPAGISLVKTIVDAAKKKKQEKQGNGISDAEIVDIIRKHEGGRQLSMTNVGRLVDGVRRVMPIHGGGGLEAVIPIVTKLIPSGIALVKSIIESIKKKKKKKGKGLTNAELLKIIRSQKGGEQLSMNTVGKIIDTVQTQGQFDRTFMGAMNISHVIEDILPGDGIVLYNDIMQLFHLKHEEGVTDQELVDTIRHFDRAKNLPMSEIGRIVDAARIFGEDALGAKKRIPSNLIL